jgi:hypothetical protein
MEIDSDFMRFVKVYKEAKFTGFNFIKRRERGSHEHVHCTLASGLAIPTIIFKEIYKK